ILEDILRCCVLDFGGNWNDHLPLVEYSYNNRYQTSVGVASYEVLYRRSCKSLLYWTDPEEHVTLGPELIKETTKKIRHPRET
ncbi:hypothetical protein PanWU01x14_241430, partial [Parasponia andersonii]